MMDVTKKALRQSNEYGRPARLNVTRVGNYVSKVERIFKLLGRTELNVRVMTDRDIVEYKEMPVGRIKAMIKEYGEKYFINIYHRDGNMLIVRLMGEVSRKIEEE